MEDSLAKPLGRWTALIIALSVVVAGCTASTNDGAPAAGSSGSGTSSLTVPLQPDDLEKFRTTEANLRREGREQADLAKLGPGALELASLMDRTASFLLTRQPTAMKSQLRSLRGPGGRFASPLRDLPSPGESIVGAYLMTSSLFPEVIAKGYEQGAKTGERYLEKSATGCAPNCPPEVPAKDGCPCTGTVNGTPTTDEVTIDGNKGTITTTTTMTVNWGGGSKISFDLTVKVSGEVRDATGTFLYRIQNETTGHAEADVCPDPSGTARAKLSFAGREEYFHANGTKTGKGVIEGFSGDLRVKADDNATLAGVDITSSGGPDAGSLTNALGYELIKMTANRAAPAIEKAWRSGICIDVLVDPKGGNVEKDSVTTVIAKVKHKIDGNELDKPVEAKLDGVKSIDPAGRKQKAPATFKYTAGSKDNDRGFVVFKSVSNRGIGDTGVTFCVSCADWTINSTGTALETYLSGQTNNVNVLLKDIKVKTGNDGALTGSGTMTISGESNSILGPLRCTGKIAEQTVPVDVRGTLVGNGPATVLRLALLTPVDTASMVAMTCSAPGGSVTTPATPQAHIGFYRQAIGQFELPADGGTRTVTGSVAFGAALSINATATFVVVRGSP